MTLFKDADPRFQGLNSKVMIFAAIAVVVSVVVVITQAAKQGFFSSKLTLHVEAPTGVDLRPGMAVKLSGFQVGTVSSVDLNENARVNLQMRIEEQYMKWIKEDSLVSIAREGLIGDSYLMISSGSPNLPSLHEGAVVKFEASPGFADLAQDLRNRILPIIDGITVMLNNLNDPKGDFRGTMHEVRIMAADLHETRRRVDTLLASLDDVAAKEVPRTLATVEKELNAITARTDESLAKMDQTLASAQAAADEAAKTAKSASDAIDGASPRVNRMLDEASTAVRESRQLIDGASKRWPFKGGELPDEAPLAKFEKLEALAPADDKPAQPAPAAP